MSQAMSNAPLIDAKGISLSFHGRSVLDHIDLTLHQGEIITLIGPNGAGKTSLVRVLLGLVKSDRGTIERRPGMRIGYMPQRLHIDPSLPMTVDRFLALGLKASQIGQGRRQAVLTEVGCASIAHAPLQSISGGEQQRVMLARALLRDPDMLVLDEPVQGVDVSGQAELYALIGRIRTERNVGVLMVSHDLHVVMAATDHVMCLNQHVCCAGHPQTVSRHPEFISLFGEKTASALAVYHHHHDHSHDAHGDIVTDDSAHPHQHTHDGNCNHDVG